MSSRTPLLYHLFASPHAHSWSRIGMSDLPRSVRLYSTLGGICTREEVFITTKLLPWSPPPDADIDDSLKKLGVSYIDLVLLHQHGTNDDAVYRAMCSAVKAGKIRSIGISNFYTLKAVSHFIAGFDIPPAVVQNENHLFYQNNALRDWAARQGIFIESYYPFSGRGHTKDHLQNKTVLEIAKSHGKTTAQIIVRWHLQAVRELVAEFGLNAARNEK